MRCKGCWFFEYELDKRAKDAKDPDNIAAFLARERRRGINTALLIGGEPSLFPDKVALFVEHMDRVNVATNGLRKLPREGFENVALLVALFGGFRLDDELRAIRPGGRRFTGLLDASLENYRNDPRAFYLFAITEDGVDQIEETVKRIGANGNRLNFSFYSKYDSDDPLRIENGKRLLDVALRAKDLHPETVVSHPYYIETMITGRSHWSEFGYPVCPTVSVGHAAHSERLANGNPTLPGFRTWASDLETINFCCTSGHCDGCRDSQVVFSWLLVSLNKFRRSGDASEDLDRDRRELLEPVCLVALRGDGRASGFRWLRSRVIPGIDRQREPAPWTGTRPGSQAIRASSQAAILAVVSSAALSSSETSTPNSCSIAMISSTDSRESIPISLSVASGVTLLSST